MSKASDTLEAAVDAGDVKAAVEVLKAVKLYGEVGPPTGEEHPELLLFRRAEARAAEEVTKVTPKGDLGAMLSRDQREAELTLRRFQELRAELGGSWSDSGDQGPSTRAELA